MGLTRRRWSELGRTQQGVVVAFGSVEVVLTTVALLDLARRPADEIRGSKAFWAVAVLVQPVGPVAYLARGRVPS